jgi:hypothetical protein
MEIILLFGQLFLIPNKLKKMYLLELTRYQIDDVMKLFHCELCESTS